MIDKFKKLLTDLYDSEINLSISWLWDGGYDIKIGDEMNWYRAESCFDNLDEAEIWITENIKRLYPNSFFVKNLQQNGERKNENSKRTIN